MTGEIKPEENTMDETKNEESSIEKTEVSEKPMESVKTEKKTKKKQNKIVEKAIKSLKEVFSIKNLTLSLFSTLLLIGIGYASGVASGILQEKFFTSATMYFAFIVSSAILLILSVVAIPLLNAIYTKDWASLVYIIFLEVIWLAIFILILFFTTTSQPQTLPNFESAPTTGSQGK